MAPHNPDDEQRSEPGHRLAKSVWTDADFDSMGWHDCHVRAWAIVPDVEDEFAVRLLLDLDYIVHWAGGGRPGEPYSFWVAPATLAFHGVHRLEGKLSAGDGGDGDGLEIDTLTRSASRDEAGSYRWEFEAAFALAFHAAGFRQVFRRAPIHVERQHLTLAERGGLSFAEEAGDGG